MTADEVAAATANPSQGTLAIFRALRHRSFALLWLGQTISRVGDFLYQITLAWWVLEETGSATVMGTVLVIGILPTVLFLLAGGVMVDRFHRPRLMLLSDLARGGLMIGVAALAIAGHLTVPLVLIANLVFGVVDALFAPAYIATVPDLVPAADLPSANSLSSISMQLGRIVGPPIGAAIVAVGGTSSAFAVNGASFLASALFLLPLARLPAARISPEERLGAIAEIREGMQLVRSVPWLLAGIAVYAWVNVALPGPYSVSLPFLMDVRGWNVGTLGLLYAVFPVGYILGGVWLGRKTRLRRRAWLVYGGNIVAGLLLAAFALPLALPVLMLAALVNGAALEVNNLTWTTTLQQIVPGEKLGRVAAIDQIGSYALMPVGFALAGWATDQIGPQLVLALGGVSTALLSIVVLASPTIRKFD